MPTLKPYSAPGVGVDISSQRATGAALGSDIGAGLGAVGRGVQQVKVQMEEDEARKAIVGASQVRADYARKLDEAQVSGADTTELKQQMMDDLAKVGENFATERGHDSLALHSAQSEVMFDEQANRIAVSRASNEARLQGEQFLQTQSAALRSNPSGLPIAERNAEDLVNTFRLSPDKRELVLQDLKTQLNMAAVVSSARIDPEGTKKRLENGEWALSPKEREQGIAEADTQMRAIRADQIHQRQLADYDERKANDALSGDLLTKIYKGTLANGEIANAPLPRDIRENLSHFQSWLAEDRVNKPHPAAMMELWLDTHAPSDDARKIYNNDKVYRFAFADKISSKEAEQASAWIANQKDENNVKLMAKLQGKMTTIRAGMTADPQWAAQGELSAAVQMEIIDRATTRMNELRREGEKGKDPSLIFDPHSTEFMFKPGLLTSIANDIRAQHRDLITPRVTSKEDPAYQALQPGDHYIGPDGVPSIKQRPVGVTPAPQHATALDIQSGYIERVSNRSGEFTINAPPKSGARVLNGKRYPSREAAIEALKALP
jgi:hypothetical protein